MGSATHGGKGDTPRKVDRVKFENNWNAIFGKKEEEVSLAIGETPEQRRLDDLEHDWILMFDFISQLDENFTYKLRQQLRKK